MSDNEKTPNIVPGSVTGSKPSKEEMKAIIAEMAKGATTMTKVATEAAPKELLPKSEPISTPNVVPGSVTTSKPSKDEMKAIIAEMAKGGTSSMTKVATEAAPNDLLQSPLTPNGKGAAKSPAR